MNSDRMNRKALNIFRAEGGLKKSGQQDKRPVVYWQEARAQSN
jgi:hypothetical protein